MKLVHLFYNLMNLYGEYANLLALKRALSEKGNAAVIIKSAAAEKIEGADLIYIGSGTERSQKKALELLRPYKNELSAAMERGAIILATGNSFEMFGKKIIDKNGAEYEGLGFFDFSATESDKRTVTDSEAEFMGQKAVGFINKASEINGIREPFFAIKSGAGNSREQPDCEGIISGNFFGTHLIGPLLIRNKFIADYFADKITGK